MTVCWPRWPFTKNWHAEPVRRLTWVYTDVDPKAPAWSLYRKCPCSDMGVFDWTWTCHLHLLSVYHLHCCPIILSCSTIGLNSCFPWALPFLHPPSLSLYFLCLSLSLYLCLPHDFTVESKQPGVLFHSLFPHSSISLPSVTLGGCHLTNKSQLLASVSQ